MGLAIHLRQTPEIPYEALKRYFEARKLIYNSI